MFATPPSVLAGTQYAIVIHHALTAGAVNVGCEPGSPYAGGQGFLASPESAPTAFQPTVVDYSFQTFVEASEFTVSPESKNYGDQVVGSPVPHQTIFTATNGGSVPITISSVSIVGGGNQFIKNVDECTGVTLLPGASCPVTADFVPLSTGAKTATLRFVHNAISGSPTNVPLSGRGVAAPAADSDADGVPNTTDNCPTVANAGQADADGDGVGDACDSTPNGPPPPPTFLCAGEVVTIVGTNHRDRIKGTQGPDVIAAFGGNDRIVGFGGDDIICGGDGNDFIKGGNGNDRLKGEDGNDLIRGGPGDDRIFGGPGLDHIRQ